MTHYAAFGHDPKYVTQGDATRLALIDEQQAAIDKIIWEAPEPGPTVALIFHAHEGFGVVAGVVDLHSAAEAKRTFESTGESVVLTVGGPSAGIASLLRKGRFDEHAEVIEKAPAPGMAWVVCVAEGWATVAAVPITQPPALGSA